MDLEINEFTVGIFSMIHTPRNSVRSLHPSLNHLVTIQNYMFNNSKLLYNNYGLLYNSKMVNSSILYDFIKTFCVFQFHFKQYMYTYYVFYSNLNRNCIFFSYINREDI